MVSQNGSVQAVRMVVLDRGVAEPNGLAPLLRGAVPGPCTPASFDRFEDAYKQCVALARCGSRTQISELRSCMQ